MKFYGLQSTHLASCLGNILEWYDFGIFAIYASLFSQLFFPTETDPHHALLMTLSIIAAGFYCRPIGGLIFGYLGDKLGRASTLKLSILMISIPTLLVGCLPSYASAGYLSTVGLIILRLWQGISLGGEFSGNLLYLIESAPKKHKALFASLVPTGANIGILLAGVVSAITNHLLNPSAMTHYGWRIPYIVSGVISLIVYYTRLNMQETVEFEKLKQSQQIVNNPVLFSLSYNRAKIITTIALTAMGGTFYYLCFIYLPIFMHEQIQFDLIHANTLISICVAAMLLLVPLAGYLCDIIGPKKMMLFNGTSIILLTIPLFKLLLTANSFNIMVVLTLLTIVSSSEQVVTSLSVVLNYPHPARYTGLSIGYNIANAVFCGSAPLISELLTSYTGSPLAPAMYIVFCALLTTTTVYFFWENTEINK